MKSNLTIFAFAVLILCETVKFQTFFHNIFQIDRNLNAILLVIFSIQTFAAKFEDFVKTFPKCKESISEFHCSVSVEKDLAPTSHLASTTPYIYQKPLKNESDFKISSEFPHSANAKYLTFQFFYYKFELALSLYRCRCNEYLDDDSPWDSCPDY